MNLPNSLSLARIFFVPVLLAVLVQGEFRIETGWIAITQDWIALIIFLTAALTDMLDGYIARRRRQITTLGKLLDPVADKLLITAAFVVLVELGRVPAWMVVIIVGREFAVTALRSLAIAEGIAISASELGKAKMVSQVLAVSFLLVAPYSREIAVLADVTMWAVLLLAIASMMDYVRTFWGEIDSRSRARRVTATTGVPAKKAAPASYAESRVP